MKVLNLYAGIGGNRRLWRNVEVTAVEQNPEIAAVYAGHFPQDKVIVGDAHEFLLKNHKGFDFIWSSRPCTTHSKIRFFVGVKVKGFEPVFPDFGLYEEIYFLKHYAACKWVVENVVPFYEPLLTPTAKLGRHLFWSNFEITPFEVKNQNLRTRNKIEQVESLHGFDLSKYKIADKRQILRNCVDSELGAHVFNCAFGEKLPALALPAVAQQEVLF